MTSDWRTSNSAIICFLAPCRDIFIRVSAICSHTNHSCKCSILMWRACGSGFPYFHCKVHLRRIVALHLFDTMPSILLVPLLSATFVLLWLKKTRQKHPRLPPGPPGDPFIGHLLRMPTENQDVVLYELGKTYGMLFQ